MADPVQTAPLAVIYTNWRGETSERLIVPRSVRFVTSEWHPEPQWLLLAHDAEKCVDREFAMSDMRPADPAPVAPATADAGGDKRNQMISIADAISAIAPITEWPSETPLIRRCTEALDALAAHPVAEASAAPGGDLKREFPCKGGGGNDVISCTKCGLEWEYTRRGSNEPTCPHAAAPGDAGESDEDDTDAMPSPSDIVESDAEFIARMFGYVTRAPEKFGKSPNDRLCFVKALNIARRATQAPPQPAQSLTKNTPLTADFANKLPGGVADNCSYSDVEDALDRAEAPMTDKGRYLTLPERIAAFRQAVFDHSPQSVDARVAEGAKPGWRVVEGGRWGDRVEIDMPPNTDMIVVFADKMQHEPLWLGMPHQLSMDVVRRLMKGARSITVAPYRNKDKVTITRAALAKEPRS